MGEPSRHALVRSTLIYLQSRSSNVTTGLPIQLVGCVGFHPHQKISFIIFSLGMSKRFIPYLCGLQGWVEGIIFPRRPVVLHGEKFDLGGIPFRIGGGQHWSPLHVYFSHLLPSPCMVRRRQGYRSVRPSIPCSCCICSCKAVCPPDIDICGE